MQHALRRGRIACAGLLCCARAAALAQPSTEEMNASNNPLHPAVGLSLQDIYTGRSYGLGDQAANSALLRGTLPHKLFGVPQIMRATLPIVTTPDLPPSGRHTGAGDFNLFDVFLFKGSGVEYGVGSNT